MLPTVGLGPGAVEAFAAEVRAGLVNASAEPHYQARLCAILRLQGTVRLDPGRGVQPGGHQVSIAYDAALLIPYTGRKMQMTDLGKY